MNSHRHTIIWGSAGHAAVVNDILLEQAKKVSALFDNNPSASSVLKGTPLYIGQQGFIDWQQKFAKDCGIDAIIAIGGGRGNDRLSIRRFLSQYGVEPCNVIAQSAIISPSAIIGQGVQILQRAIVASNVTIGDEVIINNGAQVDHESRIASGVHIGPGAVLCGLVTVGAGSFIGAGAVVLPRINIGPGSIVGAGAVVTKDIPPNSKVAGNPARPL